MSNNYKISAETMALALECTKLQRETVLNIEVKKMSQRQAYIDAGGTAKNDKAADAIEAAVNQALDDGYRTGDIYKDGMKKVNGRGMTDAILARIQ